MRHSQVFLMGNVKKTPQQATMEMKITVDNEVVVDKVVPGSRSTALGAIFIGYNAFAAAVGTEPRIIIKDDVNEGHVQDG